MKTKRHKKGYHSIYLQQPSDYIISIKKNYSDSLKVAILTRFQSGSENIAPTP